MSTTPTSDYQLAPAINALLSTEPDRLDAYLIEITPLVQIAQTSASIHCHFLALDGNGRPRTAELARSVSYKILDYAVPRDQIREAHEYYRKVGSNEKLVQLQKKAQGLFTHLGQTGEGGEVLLYLLTETYLQVPQLLCKMPLKTNPEVHYHGVDGIHATANPETNMLALYWGESKLYKDTSAAFRDCLESLAKYLLSEGGSGSASDRDIQLIKDNLNLCDLTLEAALKKYLDPDDPAFNKVEYRGVCLVGFDSDKYPSTPNSKLADQLKTELAAEVSNWTNHASNQIIANKLASFDLEVFCLPFPSVADFRKAFLRELGVSGS